MAKLSSRQIAFINEYLIDLNATQAAIRAGYSPNGINKRVTRMMVNDGIQEEIQKRMKDREKRTEITQDFVLKELYAIAKVNGTDFAKVVTKSYMKPILDAEGKVIDEKEVFYKDVELELTDDIPEDKRKAISGIKQGKNGIEVVSCDKVKALELLGRHLGMFKDKVEVSGNINNPYEKLTTEELKKLVHDG